MTEQTRLCLWCHSPFKVKRYSSFSPHAYCSDSCRVSYRKMMRRIVNAYYFEHIRQNEEIEKLHRRGKDYKLEVN